MGSWVIEGGVIEVQEMPGFNSPNGLNFTCQSYLCFSFASHFYPETITHWFTPSNPGFSVLYVMKALSGGKLGLGISITNIAVKLAAELLVCNLIMCRTALT